MLSVLILSALAASDGSGESSVEGKATISAANDGLDFRVGATSEFRFHTGGAKPMTLSKIRRESEDATADRQAIEDAIVKGWTGLNASAATDRQGRPHTPTKKAT